MKISIVTVCRNDAEGLKRTIDSVRIQKYRNLEFIITDGASTDGSIEIIKRNSDIIDKWVSESDTGIYNAMNKSLKQCSGDYVIFMNAGDCFYDENVLYNVFKDNPNSDVVYGDVKFEKISYANPEIKTLQDFFCKSPFCHQGVFTKLAKIQNMHFLEDYPIVADWIMFVSLFMEGCSFRYVPFVVSQCANGGKSSDAGINNQERLRYLEEHFCKRITDDYVELMKIKGGILYNYYVRLEKTKKLKYYIFNALKLFHL